MKAYNGVAFALAALLGACASPQQTSELAQLSGPQMYYQLCASCHGVDGLGDGPVAALLTNKPLDLTRIAYREGGEFPSEDVRRIIDGRFERPAHGSRDMPVWGWQFYDASNSDDERERARVDALIGRLVDYLRSIQVDGESGALGERRTADGEERALRTPPHQH